MNDMGRKQLEIYKQIGEKRQELFESLSEYWWTYSSFDTWQFWVKILLLIIPLVVLYVAIDRKRMYQLGFYGFSVHTLAIYVDTVMQRLGMWDYPHYLTPLIPINVSIGASLLPVVFILVYQHTLNKGKNYFVYIVLASLIMGLVFKPLMAWLGLFDLNTTKFTYFGITMKYIGIGIVSFLLSNLFGKLHKTYNPEESLVSTSK